MQIGIPIKPTSFTTTIVDTNVPITFDNTKAVVAGGRVLFEDNYIYEARTNIYTLASYSLNQFSTPDDAIVTKLSDKSVVITTSVSVVQNSTVVYIQDAEDITLVKKYYMYIGSNDTEDFTTIDFTNTSLFKEVKNYRNSDAIPAKVSLYWKYIEVLNSKKLIDGTIYNQTIGATNNETYEFTINEYVNTIAFFNLDCTSLKVTMRLLDDTVVMEETTYNMLDLQGIMTSYEWHFSESGSLKPSAIVRLPIYRNVKVTVEFINTNNPPKIGEVVFVKVQDIGKTLNNPQGRKKKFDTVTIDKNGAKTVTKSNTIIDELTYKVAVPTAQIDYIVTKWSKLINENILIIGDESERFSNLINYASIAEFPYEIEAKYNENIYEIKATIII